MFLRVNQILTSTRQKSVKEKVRYNEIKETLKRSIKRSNFKTAGFKNFVTFYMQIFAKIFILITKKY